MRVLHVIDSLGVGGGAEHSLLAMLPQFAAREIDSQVVCLVRRDHGLFEQVQDMGVPYSVLPGRSLFEKARALRGIVKATKPDIVHATLVNSSMVVRFACMGLPVSQIHSLVNTTYDPSRTTIGGVARWKLSSLRLLDSLSARAVKGRFHAITEAVKQEAVETLGIPPQKVTVIPRGRSRLTLGERTSDRRVAARQMMECQDADIVVLNVGRQDWIKGQELLIRGFDLAAAEDSRLQLWIAGREGDASDMIREVLDSAASKPRIQLLGHRTDVADLLCAADMFVASSYHEGFGGVLIEAMALQCPIIASDNAAFGEVLGAPPVGVLVQRDDARAMSEALLHMASADDERTRLAREGHIRYLSYFELESVSRTMVDLYREVATTAAK
jgi:glycosyltransferase involved in cell wall biosynthesis